MERFRLRARHEPRRGTIWELHLFPDHPYRAAREVDGRVLGSASAPETVHWLRQVADPYLARSQAPTPIAGEEFGHSAEPRWLRPEDGMRLALAFSAARYLVTPRQRRLFRDGLDRLPPEVMLYWFTLCFYGYRQAAGRAALRTLLTHDEADEAQVSAAGSVPRGRKRVQTGPDLFSFVGEGQPSLAQFAALFANGSQAAPGALQDESEASTPPTPDAGDATALPPMRYKGRKRRLPGSELTQSPIDLNGKASK